jgi:hypothetical protein
MFEHASTMPGHIGNAHQARRAEPTQSHFEADWGAWGAYTLPRFAAEAPQPAHTVQTLSLWASLDAAKAFAYQGPHLEAMRHRAEWMHKYAHPTYVLWWVGDATPPTWSDACTRLEQLHAHGPTPKAFSFKRVFEPDC